MLSLALSQISKSFGGIQAVADCTLELKPGLIYGLIGPNGSGKTTLLNLVSNLFQPDQGCIYFQGKEITGLAPHRICRLGLGRTFQLLRIFPRLTALENLLAVAPATRGGKRQALELLEQVNLAPLRDEPAGNLSYGQQKLLDFVRVLMLQPTLLLLDEPFGGVNPAFVENLTQWIRRLNSQEGKTFLIVEHNIRALMALAHYVFVLDYGEIIAQGDPQKVQNDERVIEAYFGR